MAWCVLLPGAGGVGRLCLAMDQPAVDATKIEEIDQWLLKLDGTRVEKSLPRPLYEKIKDFITSSLRRDFDMLIEGYDFFDQLKP